MLQVCKLGKRYGARLVFRDLSFEVPAGQAVAVVGANGSGKSTLLKLVAGLVPPTSGTVRWEIDGAESVDELKWQCGLCAPDAPAYRELSVLENLRFFAQTRTLGLTEAQLLEHLDKFALSGRCQDLAGDLSSGLRARLQLAVATLHQPPVLLLDEPTANLDAAGREMVAQVLFGQRARGIALVATNNSLDLELCQGQIKL